MTQLTQAAILKLLDQDWAEYPHRFQALSAEAQSAFLTQQGYARFADLLAHLVAWWELGAQSIARYLSQTDFQPPAYDVDTFNAAAVARAAGLSEAEALAAFEQKRLELLDFVKRLPPTAFENEKIIHQFNLEFAGHLHEHQIPDKA